MEILQRKVSCSWLVSILFFFGNVYTDSHLIVNQHYPYLFFHLSCRYEELKKQSTELLLIMRMIERGTRQVYNFGDLRSGTGKMIVCLVSKMLERSSGGTNQCLRILYRFLWSCDPRDEPCNMKAF
ncbi:hypothetical protein Pfo_013652 [Paulownia fortunei]|nr:hypothetical protein Pfo_013652 [Paulownia fortunei]